MPEFSLPERGVFPLGGYDGCMDNTESPETRLRSQYGQLAGGGAASAQALGYSTDEIANVPEGAIQMGLGCGNPTTLANLQAGQTVLDLGSGAGLDAFIAAQKVGPTGRAIGVDMTPEMVAKANRFAQEGGFTNVEFKLGRIEQLPLPDASIDIIISNCVINHSTDKPAVFREALRVLRPGGLLLVSDLVVAGPLPPLDTPGLEVWKEWLAVAGGKQEYLSVATQAGFSSVVVVTQTMAPAIWKSRLLTRSIREATVTTDDLAVSMSFRKTANSLAVTTRPDTWLQEVKSSMERAGLASVTAVKISNTASRSQAPFLACSEIGPFSACLSQSITAWHEAASETVNVCPSEKYWTRIMAGGAAGSAPRATRGTSNIHNANRAISLMETFLLCPFVGGKVISGTPASITAAWPWVSRRPRTPPAPS